MRAMWNVWNNLPYQNLILVGVVVILLGSVLIITKIKENLNKLSLFTYLSLWIAVIILVNYIIINKGTLLEAILLGIVLTTYAYIQNIIDNKEPKETEAIKEEN